LETIADKKSPPPIRLKLSAHFARLCLLLIMLHFICAIFDDWIVDIVPKEYDVF